METTLDVYMTLEYPASIPVEIFNKRAFIGHDFQVDDANFTAYYPRVCNSDGTPKLIQGKPYGLPETEKMGVNAYDVMHEGFQRFWFGLMDAKSSLPLDTLKRRWADLTAGNKAFCNKRGGINNPGTDKQYLDYINGTSYGTTAPMSKERVTTCGNMVIMSGGIQNMGGVPFIGVLCLDPAKLPTVTEILAHPLYNYFIHTATVCRPEPANAPNFPRNSVAPHGTYIVNPFPHLDGADVPVPFVSGDGEIVTLMGLNCRVNWIAQRRLVALDNDEMPSVYVR